MRKFTTEELEALTVAMRDLADQIVEASKPFPLSYYGMPEPGSSADYAQSALELFDTDHPARQKLQNMTQQLVQCPCFTEHGLSHAVAFLKRYAEIALETHRQRLI